MDNLTKEQRLRNMRNIRSNDTKPEKIVRSLLHRAGFRYRLHRRDLPGKPDIVFPSRRKVIYVHGCYWHQHPGCRRCTQPTSNREYWLPKLQRNVERDAENIIALDKLGWSALIVWECQVKDTEALLPRIITFLNG